MATAKKFVVCLDNQGYEVSLERRKLYQVLSDRQAAKHQQIRVIDESGEDYRTHQVSSHRLIFRSHCAGQ